MNPRDRDADGVALAFLQSYAADRARGAARSLAEYQARFAGYEGVIAAEYERLQGEGGAASSAPGVTTEITTDEGLSERYEQRGEIGRGGMGRVYRVWDRQLRRMLAMKVSRPGTDSGDSLRLLEEAQVTAQLSHPAVVPVHEVGVRADGTAYFTMALVEGQSFKEVIAAARNGDPTWTVNRALDALLRVCDAVAFAHSKNVVHRDLKPANVMVGRFGETFVMDWGLARVLDQPDRRDLRIAPEGPADCRDQAAGVRSTRRDLADSEVDSPLLTMEGDVIGTPAYMAPEQARGEVDRVGSRVDVYAIGAMLYHLLGGRVPYAGDGTQTSSRSILARVVAGPPPLLSVVKPGLPPELVAICERAMAHRPEDRYADVGELAADLRAYLEIRVVRAYHVGALARLFKWVRRNRALAMALAGVVLALVVGLFASVVYRNEAEGRLALAMTAIDRMLDRVGADALEDVPEAQPVRRDVLDDALGLLRSLLQDRPRDPVLRERVAITRGVLGHVVYRLGDHERAEGEGRAAIATLEELVREQPRAHKLKQELARNRSWLSSVLEARGELDAAVQVLEASAVDLERWCEASPEVAGLRYLLADSEQRRASLLQARGRVEEAITHEERAVELIEALLAAVDERQFLTFAANAYNFLGTCYMEQGKHERQRDCSTKALAYIDRALAQRVDAHGRQLRAGILTNLAITTRRLSGAAEAVPLARSAVSAFRGLAADYPSISAYRSRVGSNLNNLCGYLHAAGDHTGSLRAGAEAVFHQRAVMTSDPRPDYGNRLRKNFQSCLHAATVASAAAVARVAEELLAMAPETVAHEWEPAAALAILARHGRTASNAADACRRHAALVLRAALTNGYTDSDLLRAKQFSWLHEDAEFRELFQQVVARDEFPLRDADDHPGAFESRWVTEASRAELDVLVAEEWRILDLAIDSPEPLRFSATLVRNMGLMRRSWRWQCDQPLSSPALVEFARGGRAVDIEIWRNAGEQRSATVVVESLGVHTPRWRWQTTADLSERVRGSQRYTDFVVDGEGEGRRVTFVGVGNLLWETRDWRAGYDLTEAEVERRASGGWQPIEIDRAGDLRCHCLFVRDDAVDRRHFLARTRAEVDALLAEHRGRLTKVQSFERDGQRYYDGIYIAGGAL